MSGVVARRLAGVAITAATGVTVAALAVPTAYAAGFGEDFAGSSLTSNGAQIALSTADGTAVQPISVVKVKFTSPIKLVQHGNQLGLPADSTAAAPYFADPATPGTHLAATDTVDPDDAYTLDVTPTNPLADGTYEVHVTAFDGDAGECDDWQASFPPAVTLPSCTKYDDWVMNAAPAPFTVTVDSTAPATAIGSVNGGVAPINADHVKNVAVAGTTDADTASIQLGVKSSGGGATRLIPVTITPHSGAPSTWAASDDLSNLPDGTLTFTAVGTDAAGNKTDTTVDTNAVKTVGMAAHPGAPASVSAKSADSAVKVSWTKPTLVRSGHPITAYVLSATDNATKAVKFAKVTCATTCPTTGTVKGLTNGDLYTVRVAASTDAGVGLPASTTARPKAATRVTAAVKPSTVLKGKKIVLRGRVATVSTGTGVKNVKLVVTPKFANGSKGTPFTVGTDMFGDYAKTLRPTRTTTYVVHWKGNGATLASTGKAKVTIARQAAGLPHTG